MKNRRWAQPRSVGCLRIMLGNERPFTAARYAHSNQRAHLVVAEPAREPRHHSLPGEHHAAHLSIRHRSAAGEGRSIEDAM